MIPGSQVVCTEIASGLNENRRELARLAKIASKNEIEAAALVIARRGLGHVSERVPKLLVDRFIKAKEGFRKLNNWQQWSAVKKSILKYLKKKGVNSLVFWQVHRKKLLGAG